MRLPVKIVSQGPDSRLLFPVCIHDHFFGSHILCREIGRRQHQIMPLTNSLLQLIEIFCIQL